jgi:hypothetical protein
MPPANADFRAGNTAESATLTPKQAAVPVERAPFVLRMSRIDTEGEALALGHEAAAGKRHAGTRVTLATCKLSANIGGFPELAWLPAISARPSL